MAKKVSKPQDVGVVKYPVTIMGLLTVKEIRLLQRGLVFKPDYCVPSVREKALKVWQKFNKALLAYQKGLEGAKNE